MFRLRCAVQNYEWGKPAATSIVARLKQLNALACSNDDQQVQAVDEQKPYAEFWMGAHKNGPNFVLFDNQNQKEILLTDYVANNQAVLGEAVLRKFANESAEQSGGLVQLPFLFKVLSVNKALSIQIHPDKPNARDLRKRFPNLYPDDNHKPEMAVAVGEFECMCAFRPASEIAGFIANVPELRTLVGEASSKSFSDAAAKSGADVAKEPETVRATLSECFNALMNAKDDDLAKALQSHLKRIEEKRQSGTSAVSSEEELVERLFRFYGNDVGCFAVYFLNTIRLQDGEAVFLGANVPHCYLFGDCVELMACSDNVVRAGLTPKYRDVATLCRLVECAPRDPAAVRFAFSEERSGSTERRAYVPPVDDFSLERYRVSRAALRDADVQISPAPSASILLVLNGDCVLQTASTGSHGSTVYAHAGTCVFLPAHAAVSVKHKVNVNEHRDKADRDAFWHVDSDNVILFRAFCKA